MKIFKLTYLFIAFAVLVAGGAAFIFWLSAEGDNKGFAVQEKTIITVKPGMNTRDIAQLLHEKKLVKNPQAFVYEARWHGLANAMQAGRYELVGGVSNKEIFDTLINGRIQFVKFVVPEGYNVRKIAIKLQQEELGNAEAFLAAAKDYAPFPYMQTDNPAVTYKAEGFAFPATYEFSYDIDEKQILEEMVTVFDKKMEQEGVKQEVEARQLQLRDVVNVAAMVELEAVHTDEQPRIAGVFLKRLEIGMPIQSDTTVQYLFDKQKEVVLYKDLEIDSPYNTYKYPGLPPGPIGSPGVSAIKAVLQPEQNDYLYFVAEKSGYHRFTRTFAEHQQAIDAVDAGQ